MTGEHTQSDPLTWAVLLAHWMDYAKSAVSLPPEGEAGKHRASVAPVITLAAITHALGELDRLEPDEQAMALDRSEIMLRQEVERLDAIWEGSDPPEEVWVFIENAALALGGAQGEGFDFELNEDGIDRVLWGADADGLSWEHPAELLGAVASLSPTIELWVPSPGIPFFKGSVVCHVQDEAGVSNEAIALITAFLNQGKAKGSIQGPAESNTRFQTFREFDFLKGGPVQDVVASEEIHELIPGQPLLVLGVSPRPGEESAEIEPVPMPPRKSAPIEKLPVYMATPDDGEDDEDEENDWGASEFEGED